MFIFKTFMSIFLMGMISQVTSKPTIDYCLTCKNINKFISEMQQNQTDYVISTNLYKMCLKENDSSNSRVCVFLATSIQNTLKHIGENDFCEKINACSSEASFEKLSPVNNERCEFCYNLIDSFKSLLADQDVDELRNHLNYYCELTGDFKDECQKNINQNLVSFIDLAQNKMDSKLFCNAIKSCNHQTIEDKSQPNIGDLISLRDPDQMAGHLDFIEQQQNTLSLVDTIPKVNSVISCLVCRKIIALIYSELHKNATRENIEKNFARICKTIFSKDLQKEKECESKLITNTDLILQSFMNYIPPGLVCILTGMCIPAAQSKTINEMLKIDDLEIENKSVEISIKNATFQTQDQKCFFCNEIVNYLLKELDKPKSKEYIKHVLEKSCKALFTNHQKYVIDCDAYVDAYTSKFIDLFEKIENPGLICNAIHLCHTNSEIVEKWDLKKLDKNLYLISKSNEKEIFPKNDLMITVNWCQLCEQIYPIMSEILQINEVKDELSEMAHDFCDKQILPINTTNCNMKVDKFFDIIAHVKNAKDACKNLSLCLAQNEKILSDFPFNNQETFNSQKYGTFDVADNAVCISCKIFIKSIYADLNRIIHRPLIGKYIKELCGHIHDDSLKNKCEEDSYQILNIFIKDLQQYLPPQKACELLQYCHANKKFNSLTSLKPVIPSSMCNLCKSYCPGLHLMLQIKNVRQAVINITEIFCNYSERPKNCVNYISEIIENLADEKTANTACSSLCQVQIGITGFSNLSGCEKCQILIATLDYLSSNNILRHKLESYFEEFCESSNSERTTECKQLIKSNLFKLNKIIQDITNYNNGFCISIDYCEKKNIKIEFLESNDANELLRDNGELIKNAEKLLDDTFITAEKGRLNNQICELCRKIFEKINNFFINQESTKDMILKFLLATCPKESDKCRNFYKKYIDYFYDKLVNCTKPSVACSISNLCLEDSKLNNDELTAKFSKFEIKFAENADYDEYKLIISNLISAFKNKKFIHQTVKEMQKIVCGTLANVERDTCDKIISKFGQKFLKNLLNNISKNKIDNHELKIHTNEFENDIDLNSFDFMTFVQDDKCSVCQKAVEKLNNLRGQSSERFSVENICNDDSECSDFMFTFQEFFQSNEASRDPMTACTQLNICSISGDFQSLSDIQKCKFGPEYFCLSSAHAKFCKKTQFCEKNYWQAVH